MSGSLSSRENGSSWPSFAADVLSVGRIEAGTDPRGVSQDIRTDLPYLRGRAEFDSVFSDLAKGKRNWQLAAFGSLGVSIVLAGGMISLTTQSRITPYVVEVDRLGAAQAFGPADQLRSVDQRIIVSQLARFIRDIRTVLGDVTGQADLVRRAYAFVDQDAAPFLSNYFAAPANDPRILGRDLTRLVEITSVLPIPRAAETEGPRVPRTWKVSWNETSIPRSGGGAPIETAWEGYFTTRLVPPATLDRITLNPLGLYVTSINWTQLSQRSGRTSGATHDDSATHPAPTPLPSTGVVP